MSIIELKTDFLEIEYNPVEFTNRIHPRLKVSPMYFELGFSSSPLIFGRYAVLQRLYKVIELLPEEYGILVWDVYRTREVQARLFNWMKEEIKKRSPSLPDDELYIEATKYMSAPSRIGDTYCPPHLSGGAIDLTLYEVSTGKPLDMGTLFDDCTQRANRDYFNERTDLSISEEHIKERRSLLCETMESVGFCSYQYEWWHFDIGNIFWSKIVEQPVLFGPLFGDEELPKCGKDSY